MDSAAGDTTSVKPLDAVFLALSVTVIVNE
jgi:hypothetical protein